MPDLEDRTATTQAVLAICGAALLAFAGLALGVSIGYGSAAAGAVAGLFTPPGVVSIIFALRHPPRLPPVPKAQ